MGWINCDFDPRGIHEGYLVGVVPRRGPDSWLYRELSSANGDDDRREIPLRFVQVGCDCGWRSPRIEAPMGTHYWPSYVEAPEWFEDDCRKRWREHVKRETLTSSKPATTTDGTADSEEESQGEKPSKVLALHDRRSHTLDSQ